MLLVLLWSPALSGGTGKSIVQARRSIKLIVIVISII